MEGLNWKAWITTILAVLGFAGTLVTLATGVPQISTSIIGRIFLIVLCLGSAIYLGFFFYKGLIVANKKMTKSLNEIEKIITDFATSYANQPLLVEIDSELITQIVATKRMSSKPIKVKELHFLPNNGIRLEIDKGFDDGIRDGMQFKVFHNSRWTEIGVCGCTVSLKRTTLVVPISPACPITQNEIKQDNLEVRLIEPTDSSRINQLLASLQCLLNRD